MKFCHTFRYGLFLRFVFQHLAEPNRAWLLGVYVVAPRPLLSLLWNNLCDLVYTRLLSKPTESDSGSFRYARSRDYQTPTRHALLGHRKRTYSCYHGFRAVYMIWAPVENSKISKFLTYHIPYVNLGKKN